MNPQQPMQTNPNGTLSIAVFSGKGGVGKSSLSANLGFCLSESGLRCLLMDCDLGLANLDILLGISSEATIQDLLVRDIAAQRLVQPVAPNLDLLPAASGVPELVEMDEDQRGLLLKKLEPIISDYAFLILDMAAGLNPTLLAMARAAAKRIVVLTPEPTSLTDAYAVIKVLSAKADIRDFLILVNQVANREEAQTTHRRLDAAVEKFLGFKTHYLGMVRSDPNMGKAVAKQQALMRIAPKSPAAEDIRVLAERLQSLRAALMPGLLDKPALANF